MNEIIFFLHIILMVCIVFGALKMGKEALVSLTAILAVAANFFVLKQIVLFGWNVTCSDVFAVGSILSLNLLQEYFGKESAQHATWICFFMMIFFGIMSQFHLLYVPSVFDQTHHHYSALLSPTPRLLLASLFSFFLVQQIDVTFFGFLKRRFTFIGWRLRNGTSLFVSQLLDTLFFSLFGLYGLVSSLASIILASFITKLLIIATTASLSSFNRLSRYPPIR